MIAKSDARNEWSALISAVADAARPGGPLEGFVFHGTSIARASSALAAGMTPRPGALSCWAVADVAGIYARDRAAIDSHGDVQSAPALLALRLADIPDGRIYADEAALEEPVGRRYGSVRRDWERAGGRKGGWRASLEACGCVEVSPSAASAAMTGPIASLDDLSKLIERLQEPDAGAFPAP